MIRIVLAAVLGAALLPAQSLPEFYRTVSRLTWVVKDADAVSSAWRKAGVPVVRSGDVVRLEGRTYKGQAASGDIYVATGVFGDVLVDWVQPLGKEGAFAEFLSRHGDGVFSLVHRVPDVAAFEAELARLGGLGVKVLDRARVSTDSGTIHIAYMDTEKEGKYSLGLIAMPQGMEEPRGMGRTVNQFAFIAKQLEPVSAYWQKLGFPAMSYTEPKLTDMAYREKPQEWKARLGWQRHGKVTYEWIEPQTGPSTYHEHLAKYGEGFHHLGLPVTDMDAGIAEWKGFGYGLSMSGGWGEKGKPGSGRFAYHDTRGVGGIEIELLWSYRN
ncbi:MAG: VOC family protein [Bryobacteraceae bacterium]|nr:VOC family protein [Bryobacteraceae bacterium]